MKRITPRTCLWPLTGCLCVTFALSIGLTYRSNHHCFAGVCGEWLFPLQARLHVVIWYMWISLSVLFLALRAFQPPIRRITSQSLGFQILLLGKELRIGGILLVFWICSLYGIVFGVWWLPLRDYFDQRGSGLPGNRIVAAVAMSGHLADITMGMALLPVSRHSALASFFKLSPSTTFTFHMISAYALFAWVIIHGSLYANWATLYNHSKSLFRHVLPVLNPTYLYAEVWPGSTSALGVWRASLIFTGIASSLIMVAMFLTSFPAIRRKHFNLFYFTHLMGIVAVVVICLHASTMFYCTIPGLSMWLLDWGMRIYELRKGVDSNIKALGKGWYSLTMPLPRERLSGCACHSPLAHFYIHHSESSIRETHPFTTITHLASKKTLTHDGKDCISIQFLFKESTKAIPAQPLALSLPQSQSPSHSQPASRKPSKQWTNRLGSIVVDEEKLDEARYSVDAPTQYSGPDTTTNLSYTVADNSAMTILRLEGPYFIPANPERYKTVVCLVAGTGLSGAIAIAAAFQSHRSVMQPTSNPPIKDTKSLHSETPTTPANGVYWDKCVVLWSVREADFVEMPFFDALACDGLDVRVHKTGGGQSRLDVYKELTDICGSDGSDSWCYISGPNGFISAAEQQCKRVKGLTWFAARWD